MRVIQCFLLAALLGAVGCQTVTGPERRLVTGSVRYADGSVAAAKVWTADGPSTFTDARGRYRIFVPARGTVTIHAKERPAPGFRYAVTYSGSAAVSGVETNIVLDQATLF
jgi:hypothetical protein